MHIAAAEPRFLRREDVTEKDLETEREIARDAAAQVRQAGEHRREDGHRQDGEVLRRVLPPRAALHPRRQGHRHAVPARAAARKSGCEYTVTRFTRYKLGEGIEKRSEDFAAEVASYMKSVALGRRQPGGGPERAAFLSALAPLSLCIGINRLA